MDGLEQTNFEKFKVVHPDNNCTVDEDDFPWL